MVTIKDISKACGVSVATVSKALNGYGDIKEETRELVLKTVAEMHYFPNAAAQLLRTNNSHNIGVLFSENQNRGLRHEYFSGILESIKSTAEGLGYDITFVGSNIGNTEMTFLEHCLYRKCDGVVIVNADFSNEEVLELVRSEIPTVLIDYTFDNNSSILSDNVEGAYALTDYLAEMGHRKIAFIHGEKNTVTGKRLAGFYRALEKWGIEIPPEYVKEGIFHNVPTSEKATEELMKLPDPPTAIMYPDDISFIGGMNMLNKMSISIPDQVSVVGYDGISLTEMLRPRLTTYYQDVEKLGYEASRKLIEEIENKKTYIAETIAVSGRLIKGETVKQLL